MVPAYRSFLCVPTYLSFHLFTVSSAVSLIVLAPRSVPLCPECPPWYRPGGGLIISLPASISRSFPKAARSFGLSAYFSLFSLVGAEVFLTVLAGRSVSLLWHVEVSHTGLASRSFLPFDPLECFSAIWPAGVLYSDSAS